LRSVIGEINNLHQAPEEPTAKKKVYDKCHLSRKINSSGVKQVRILGRRPIKLLREGNKGEQGCHWDRLSKIVVDINLGLHMKYGFSFEPFTCYLLSYPRIILEKIRNITRLLEAEKFCLV
jgi:hypothetical protein